MRISLNLATRPFADLGPTLKRLRMAMLVLAVLAIGFGAGVHALHNKAQVARANIQKIQSKIDRIAQEREGYQELMRRPENALLLLQVAALNKLFDEKSFSWTLAIEDLETVLPSGVQVSSLEPTRAKDGHITLHLRVIGPRDRAVDLVRNLEHSKRFLLPRIVGESAETTGGAGERMEPVSASNRVNFDLFADYNSVASSEPRSAKKPGKSAAETVQNGAPARRPGSGGQLSPTASKAQPRHTLKPDPGSRP